MALSGLSKSAMPPCISCISLSCSGSMFAIILGITNMMPTETRDMITIGLYLHIARQGGSGAVRARLRGAVTIGP